MSELAPISDRFRDLLNAACDCTLSDEGLLELETLLEADPAARKIYMAHVRLRSDIRFLARAERARDLALDRVSAIRDLPDNSADESAPPIVIVVDSPPTTVGQPTGLWGTLTGYFGQVGPLSYLTSALVMCIAVLVAWQWNVDGRHTAAIQRPAPSNGAAADPKAREVGRIVNMMACRLLEEHDADRNTKWRVSSRLVSGQKFRLASGMLEIAYDSDAAVILQGPAAFEVGVNGGFLSAGRLTCRLDSGFGIGGQGAEIHSQRSRASDSNPGSNAFCIRTPTAIISDLGTEFGVEVDSQRRTTTHVFRGSVSVSSILPTECDGEIVLKENEGACVAELGQRGMSCVERIGADSSQFVRRMPRGWSPIRVFGTGLATTPTLCDLHWRVVARSDDPAFQPQDAVVVAYLRPKWRPDGPLEAPASDRGRTPQWVSTHGLWNSPLTPGATCTFRTQFALPAEAVSTAVLRGRYNADRCVHAIRLNGCEVALCEGEKEAKYEWERGIPGLNASFTASSGFVEGDNVLEMDVEADDAPDNCHEMEAMGLKSALGLRVWLQGSWRLLPQEGQPAN